MDADQLRTRLLATFVEELHEHTQLLDAELLALEREPAGPASGERLRSALRSAHALKGAARAVALAPIEALCHRMETVLAAARDHGGLPGAGELQRLLEGTAALGAAERALRSGSEPDPLPLEAAARALEVVPAEAQAAPAEPPSPAPPAPPAPAAEVPTEAAVRVAAEELDRLVGWSGELLVARGRVERHPGHVAALRTFVNRWSGEWKSAAARLIEGTTDRRLQRSLQQVGENLRHLASELDRLEMTLGSDARELAAVGRSLEDGIRQLRMVPFGQATEGLERAGRDLARAAGKEIALEISGTEVRLDRAVAESLRDPLLQLVRNAIDHGLETPEARAAAGKEPRGRIEVAARLRGEQVEIAVEDDGTGLDLAAIRTAAERAGLEVPADPRDAVRLLFHPGFSTRDRAGEVSGRGMGLDVVRSRVESLRGSIGIRWREGSGTRFELTVPLTLSTGRMLLVGAARETLALPSSAVEGVGRVQAEQIRTIEGREAIFLGGRPVPLVPLATTLGLREVEPPRPEGSLPILILGMGDHRAAFAVDELIGEEEVLVKGLGARLRRVRNVTAGALLPSGNVALILSPADLLDAALGVAPRVRLASALAPARPERRHRVILADDSPTTRSLERSILEAAGYEVLAVPDGAEAWRILQEQGADLLVADVEMPGLDGFTLTETVRRSRRFQDLPVVLVTGLETEADKAHGLRVGANAYLVKSSFDQRGLLDTVARLL